MVRSEIEVTPEAAMLRVLGSTGLALGILLAISALVI